jgi:hypothetical protein
MDYTPKEKDTHFLECSNLGSLYDEKHDTPLG